MAKDPYKVLGVDRQAGEEDIRKAYRALAKKHHPDLNVADKGAEERFKEISAAYDILGDAEKRKRFDAGLIDAEGQERPQRPFYREYAGGPEGSKYQGYGDDWGTDDLGSVFSELFGRRAAGQARGGFAMPGGDMRYSLSVSFLEAARGARRRLTLPDGSSLEVQIPAGLENGQTLRLKSKGEPGFGGGPPGDALIMVSVEPHPTFERKGLDIQARASVPLETAVLGGRVEIETIAGPVALTVPPNANAGQVLRLKGRGIVTASGASGDHLARLEIVMPTPPDEELRRFFENRRKSGGRS